MSETEQKVPEMTLDHVRSAMFNDLKVAKAFLAMLEAEADLLDACARRVHQRINDQKNGAEEQPLA